MGGVGRYVREQHGRSTPGSSLPSTEGKSEGGVGHAKAGYDKDHYRHPHSLERLRLSRGDSEWRIHGGGGLGEKRAEHWYWKDRIGVRHDDWMGSATSGHADPVRFGTRSESRVK